MECIFAAHLTDKHSAFKHNLRPVTEWMWSGYETIKKGMNIYGSCRKKINQERNELMEIEGKSSAVGGTMCSPNQIEWLAQTEVIAGNQSTNTQLTHTGSKWLVEKLSIAIYEGQWWLALVLMKASATETAKLKFLHPTRPSPSSSSPQDLEDILTLVDQKCPTSRTYYVLKEEINAVTTSFCLAKKS
ncbi:hypothetical protein PR048_001009 [Dryococelus australis]|uniref:Uncharacterized protein n=1 Tax=Dryococelus australis TaxID=614101 RepID=A0ABQ9IIL5_9NEOP|nr:hypothetical protein PR048_001009 [Dryococelus australis]